MISGVYLGIMGGIRLGFGAGKHILTLIYMRKTRVLQRGRIAGKCEICCPISIYYENDCQEIERKKLNRVFEPLTKQAHFLAPKWLLLM